MFRNASDKVPNGMRLSSTRLWLICSNFVVIVGYKGEFEDNPKSVWL